MSDKELWIRIRHGDANALEKLYNRYYSFLLSFGLRSGFTKEDVMDAIHEVFVILFTKRNSLRITYLKSYLFKSLLNALINKRNKNNKFSKFDSETIFSFQTDIDSDDNHDDLAYFKMKRLQHAINQLNERQKKFLYCRYILDLTWDEISHLFEISNHSCMNQINRCINKLKKIIEENNFKSEE